MRTPPATPRATSTAASGAVSGDVWAALAMTVAVLWVYLPPGLLTGGSLYGSDFISLHVRRLAFGRGQLLGPSPNLPGWYPREMLGTPFWSNLQNFPLLPTRLPLLLVDPWASYAVGVNVAAVLAAAFTFLLARRLGVGRLGAAVAGWTFACCGFFASRVMAGHLPLLEAYPALPLLLWLVERYVTSDSPRDLRVGLVALGLVSGAVVLAGHPQLPVYAVAVALLYVALRGHVRRGVVGVAAMVAGVGCAAFALYPMARLVARSTRVLALAPAANDFPFPLWRLKAFVTPWADGWPSIIPRTPNVPFARPNELIFWDTVCYVGLLPLAAAAFLVVRAAVTRRPPARPWLFIAAVGLLALLLALPRPGPGASGGSWTLLRSPARQLYLTGFALSLAAGAAVDALFRLRHRFSGATARFVVAATVVLVAAHAFDLRRHASAFVMVIDAPADEDVSPALAQALGDGRAAIDTDLVHPLNRRVDDVGVFDSILLARPYRALLALSGQAPQTNTQMLSGPELGRRALQWAGVTVAMTTRRDLNLPVISKGNWLNLYSVPDPLPRAGFVSASAVRYADDETALEAMRRGATPDARHLLLPPRGADPPSATTAPDGTARAASVTYRRPSPDRIEVDVRAAGDGYVRVLEAFDPGWSATVDGHPAELLPADTFVSAVRVGPGPHAVRLTYHTPGVAPGLAISAAAALGLAALVWLAPRLVAAPVGT
jgi:hypothetical protein